MQTATQQSAGVTHVTTASAISLDKIYKNEIQKPGTETAQIRQVLTTVSTYPSKKTTSDLQDGLFGNDEFGFESKVYESVETRIAWILVPEGTTAESVNAKLAMANSAKAAIYRVLSNEPILDENQAYAAAQGIRTKDQFGDKQAVRYPSNEETQKDGTANKLTLDKAGNVQYRRTFFWKGPKADVDNRLGTNVYLTANIKAEREADIAMANAMHAGASELQGQSL